MCVSVCVCVDPKPREIQVSFSKPGHGRGRIVIFIIYIYIFYIYIDWYVTQKSKSGEFVGTFCYCYYYYCCYYLCVCVCLPLQTVCCCYDKKNRLLEHNTYVGYSPLSDSDKIYRDSLSIHRLVSRKNDYSERQKKHSPPLNKFQTWPRTHWNRLPFNPIHIQQVQSPRS